MPDRVSQPPIHDREQAIKVVLAITFSDPAQGIKDALGGEFREEAERIVDALDIGQPDPELWACAIGESDHDPRCTGECGPCGGTGGVEANRCLSCGGLGKCRGCSIGYRLRRERVDSRLHLKRAERAEERLRAARAAIENVLSLWDKSPLVLTESEIAAFDALRAVLSVGQEQDKP